MKNSASTWPWAPASASMSRSTPTTTLRAYLVTQTGGDLHPNDHRALRWIGVDELEDLAWVPADRTWLSELRQALAQ